MRRIRSKTGNPAGRLDFLFPKQSIRIKIDRILEDIANFTCQPSRYLAIVVIISG